MKCQPTIPIRLFFRLLLPAFLLSTVVLNSCSDSGVDSETAEYVLGDYKDTASILPDLQKAYIEAGIIGEEGNTLVGDFINLRPLAIYKVDTLSDGTVLGLRDVHLKAAFGDPNDPTVRHNFYPLHELQFRISSITAGVAGQTTGPTVELRDSPDSRTGTGGLKAEFIHNGTTVYLVTTPGDTLNTGYAYISGIDPTKRSIALYVNANLTNPLPRSTPNRIVDRMVVKIVLQLPY